jgi:hypothetical protein
LFGVFAIMSMIVLRKMLINLSKRISWSLIWPLKLNYI